MERSQSLQAVRIVSFNIRVGCETSLAQVGSDLSSLRADLCALQEVGSHWSMGGQIDQTRYLSAAQAHTAQIWLPLLERSWELDPYQGGPFHFHALSADRPPQSRAGQFGISLSCRGSFEGLHELYLPRVKDEQRGVIQAVWNPPLAMLRPLTVLCVHLSVSLEERLEQITSILELSELSQGPMLLMGDLNDTPDSEAIRRLLNEGWSDLLDDSKSEALPNDERFTFSVARPHRRIDYLMGRGVTCNKAGVARHLTSSDHFPIWAEITW